MARTQEIAAAADGTAPVAREAVPIEDIAVLATKRGVGSVVLAGVMEFKRWRSGKQVSEKDFDRAVEEFRGAPAGGR